jgi:hypothetical protein
VQIFEDLASELNQVWTRCGREELAFPDIAQAALERFSLAQTVKPGDVLHWLAASDHLPRQFDPRSRFGNLALTLAVRDDFHIDALFWTHSTTSVHQHSFSGAFQVLHGSSLHTLWSFRESRRWSSRLKQGQLAVRATEFLKTGSIRPILPGAEMIHSLFHLESPSVTIVVRTSSSIVVSPQLSYERSGMAFDPHVALGRVEKTRQLLSLLWASGHPQRMALSELALSGLDAHSAVRVVVSIRSQVPAGTQERLIGMLAERDPELAALLAETVAHVERDRLLTELRQQTRSPRHRMLLALVLNLPDRASIDEVLRQIAPGESPENWLWDTIRSMHDTPGQQSGQKSVLGFSLNEISEEALKMLLDGYSIDEVSKTIAGCEELVEDVRALCSTLLAMPMLSPLLEQRLTPA